MPMAASPKNRPIHAEFEVGVEDPRQGAEGISDPARQKLQAIADGECQRGRQLAV
jgi:hypothetical protein